MRVEDHDLVLCQAGAERLLQDTRQRLVADGRPVGTGFLAAFGGGVDALARLGTWYGTVSEPRPGQASGELRDCERVLCRAGFQLEYPADATDGCLLAWRKWRPYDNRNRAAL